MECNYILFYTITLNFTIQAIVVYRFISRYFEYNRGKIINRKDLFSAQLKVEFSAQRMLIV